jgi:protein-S-isoprenylcysteine O-methyltransferase Ste14
MLIIRLTMSIVVHTAVFGALLFVPAGTLGWPRAWTLIGIIFFGAAASTAGLFPRGKDLLRERMKSPLQHGQPVADKIIVMLFLISFYGLIVCIPLDVFRFHVMAKPDILVSSFGLALFLAGWSIVFLALRENVFAAVVVKLQEERKQRVIDTGVYGVVRHPMYAGGILFIVGIPLWLESYACALLSLVTVATLLLRIPVEERFLRRRLKGYESYVKKVRYRLVPFLW